MKSEEKETLNRFDLWLACKLFTNNHTPFVKAVLKSESKEFKHGWNQAMVLVSQWLTDIQNGHYDTDKYDLKFDTLENLEKKWESILSKLGNKKEEEILK